MYEGETGRNGFTRGAEHQAALRLESKESPLWKHCLLEHEGRKARFSMKVCGQFKSCLVRQVNEPVRIIRANADILRNSKSEFHQAPLVRVVLAPSTLSLGDSFSTLPLGLSTVVLRLLNYSSEVWI